jgi:low affinity Fe/Cu permease
MAEFFRGVARQVTLAAGSWQFFVIAIIGIAVWAITGPIFGFSDTWQLVINTSTTILTFVLGVLILLEANRQAKESKVIHDELLDHVKGARRSLINIDEMSDEEVDKLEADLRARASRRATRSTKE